MTCIVAASDGKEVVLGGDSAYAYKDENEIYKLGEPKVSRFGELVVGCCGLFRGSHVIRQRMAWPMPGEDLQSWRLEAEDLLRKTLRDNGLTYECDDLHGERTQIQTLIGVRGRIFCFDQTICGALQTDFAAIGSGRLPAYGALYASRGLGLSLEDRVRLSLSASAEYCADVAPPFNILSTAASSIS